MRLSFREKLTDEEKLTKTSEKYDAKMKAREEKKAASEALKSQ